MTRREERSPCLEQRGPGLNRSGRGRAPGWLFRVVEEAAGAMRAARIVRTQARLAALVLSLGALTVVAAVAFTTLSGVHWMWSVEGEAAPRLRFFSAFALALIVIPLAALARACARLLLRRRADVLATQRLLGLDAV